PSLTSRAASSTKSPASHAWSMTFPGNPLRLSSGSDCSPLGEGAVLEHLLRDLDQGIKLGRLVTAPSHRSCHLPLKATRGVTIALVSSRERKRRQPGLATDDPAFVGWHQLVRGVQGSQVHFDFVCGACENRRAAAGTEKPPGVVACFAIDLNRILREYRGSVKKGPMMLAAVETLANGDPVGESRRHNSDVAAKAAARESVHAASPLKSSGRNVYNEPRRAPMKDAPAFSAVAFTASRK